MNTPISWIKAYVPDLDCTVQEYVDKMTLSGSHVENAVYLDKNLEKIVVGRIEKIEKHPDADKLVICQVNVGAEEVQIVTGASNVFKGALVPVVLDGGRVAGGLEHSRLVYTYYNLIISKFQDKIIHFTVKILLCNHVLCADFLSIPVQSSSDTALLMGFHLI